MEIEYQHRFTLDCGTAASAVGDALRGARRAVVVAHTNADGDAVGAVTALYGLLRRAGVSEVTPMLPDGCPDDLDWLPFSDLIVSGKSDLDTCRCAIAEADLIVGADISGFGRTGVLEPLLRASGSYKMLIDHHIDPERESFDIVVSDPEISSTCELIYWLMREALGHDAFDHNTATCLFTGMCTDTGTFSFSNRQASLYLAVAELLDYGIDPMEINRCIKNVFTEARLKFFGHAIAERLTVYRSQHVGLMVLTAKEMSDCGVDSHELTGLINEVMKLKDIDCGILIREERGKVRLSLRSKSVYDVNLLARELFDGGGHERAAGATSLLPLDETVAIVKKKLNLEDC